MGVGKWENAEPGVKRLIHPPGANIMMMEVHFAPGAEGTEHSHPHEQLSYCLKGKLQFRIDGVSRLVQAGDTVIIPSGLRHGVKALEESILLDVFTPLREDLLK
ncbi:MAG TPA: cupin domain-containing protein [Bacilli bacterium]